MLYIEIKSWECDNIFFDSILLPYNQFQGEKENKE